MTVDVGHVADHPTQHMLVIIRSWAVHEKEVEELYAGVHIKEEEEEENKKKEEHNYV